MDIRIIVDLLIMVPTLSVGMMLVISDIKARLN